MEISIDVYYYNIVIFLKCAEMDQGNGTNETNFNIGSELSNPASKKKIEKRTILLALASIGFIVIIVFAYLLASHFIDKSPITEPIFQQDQTQLTISYPQSEVSAPVETANMIDTSAWQEKNFKLIYMQVGPRGGETGMDTKIKIPNDAVATLTNQSTLTIDGVGYKITIYTPYESFGRSFFDTDVKKLENSGNWVNVYRFKGNSQDGVTLSYSYVSSPSFSDCIVLDNDLKAPCGVPLVKDSGNNLNFSFTCNSTEDKVAYCDTILSNITATYYKLDPDDVSAWKSIDIAVGYNSSHDDNKFTLKVPEDAIVTDGEGTFAQGYKIITIGDLKITIGVSYELSPTSFKGKNYSDTQLQIDNKEVYKVLTSSDSLNSNSTWEYSNDVHQIECNSMNSTLEAPCGTLVIEKGNRSFQFKCEMTGDYTHTCETLLQNVEVK